MEMGMKEHWSMVGKKCICCILYAQMFLKKDLCMLKQPNQQFGLDFFLPPYLDKMYNEHEGGREMADVIVSCCHASYPFQKCGIIVSEGLWLLSWDLQHGYLALMTLKVMKDGCPHCHNVPFSVILPAGECDSASLNIFLCIYTHETQWQWSRYSLYLSFFMRFDLWFIRGDPHLPVCPSSWRLPAQILLFTECIFQICFSAFISPLPSPSSFMKWSNEGEEINCKRSTKAEICWMTTANSRSLHVRME